MTAVLAAAIVMTAGAALVMDDVKPRPVREERESKPTKTPAPPPAAPTTSAATLPRPTTTNACIARRAIRDIQPDAQVEKIADLFVEDAPAEAALAMVRALIVEAVRMPKPDQRAVTMAHLGAALADLGQEEEAQAVLSQAVTAAKQAPPSGPEQGQALLLCAVGYARTKNVDRAAALVDGGLASAEVAAALADVGAAKEAKRFLEQAAVGIDEAQRPHRFSYLKALAATGDVEGARAIADGFDDLGDQALAHAQLAGALDAKRHAAEVKRAAARAHELLGSAEVKWERRSALMIELADSYRDAKDEASAAKLRSDALELARAHKTEMVGGAIMAQVAGSMAEAGQIDEAKKVLTELEGSPLVGVVALPMTRAQVENLAGDHTAALETISKNMTTWSAFAYARIVVEIANLPKEKRPAELTKTLFERACQGL